MSVIDENKNELDDQNVVLESQKEHYLFLKTLLESLEIEVIKSEKGNKSAGVRLRKNLRLLKSSTQDFIKFTLNKT